MSEHIDPPHAISFTRFEILVQTAAAVASRSSRNEKITLIAALLGRLTSDEAVSAASFMSGEIRQGALGVGRALLNGLNGVTPSPQARLTIGDVDGFFERLRALGGAGSQQQRRLLLGQLFGQATRDEQRFLARLLVGELRQGAVIGVVMEAVAEAAALSPTLVRRALMLCGETERVTRVAFERGEPGLRAIGLELFRPIRPMLAHPADSLDSALSAFAHPRLEVKLDGARVQVHKLGPDVRVFSRQGHDVTAAVPEVPELVAGLGVHDLVLDGEVLAMHADGRPYPFQTSMRRFGRRVDVESLRAELSMTPFFFDCMQCDGELLIDAPASERFARLEEVVPERFQVPRIAPADAEQARDFLARTLAAGHEHAGQRRTQHRDRGLVDLRQPADVEPDPVRQQQIARHDGPAQRPRQRQAAKQHQHDQRPGIEDDQRQCVGHGSDLDLWAPEPARVDTRPDRRRDVGAECATWQSRPEVRP